MLQWGNNQHDRQVFVYHSILVLVSGSGQASNSFHKSTNELCCALGGCPYLHARVGSQTSHPYIPAHVTMSNETSELDFQIHFLKSMCDSHLHWSVHILLFKI